MLGADGPGKADLFRRLQAVLSPTATFVLADVVVPDLDALARLRESEDGVLCVQGSQQLVHELHRRGLVDEWRLMIFPVVVGVGKRCFGDPGAAVRMRLTGSRAVGDGVVILTYEAA